MMSWLRRLRAIGMMGLLWAAAGIGAGGLIELIDNVLPGLLPFARRVDMWPQTLAIPGFIGGVLFGLVLSIVGARRRFDELTVPAFAGWGAVAGLLLGALGVSNGLPALVAGITTGGGALVAAGALWLARRARPLAAPPPPPAPLASGASARDVRPPPS